jgi:hypothetical protein
LLSKSQYYGIQGTTGSDPDRWKENRIITEIFLKWGTVKCGVLQGSISGPLLFIMYKNYLLSTISTLLVPILFTDDTNVIISSKKFW